MRKTDNGATAITVRRWSHPRCKGSMDGDHAVLYKTSSLCYLVTTTYYIGVALWVPQLKRDLVARQSSLPVCRTEGEQASAAAQREMVSFFSLFSLSLDLAAGSLPVCRCRRFLMVKPSLSSFAGTSSSFFFAASSTTIYRIPAAARRRVRCPGRRQRRRQRRT